MTRKIDNCHIRWDNTTTNTDANGGPLCSAGFDSQRVFRQKIVFLRSNVECPHNALAMQFQCIFLDYHARNTPLLKARKCQKMRKTSCCQAIYPHHFIKFFYGRRTSSVVASIFWGKFVGLRSSLVEVTAHTGIGLKIYSFYFLEIGMFISQKELHITSIVPETHPSL